MFLPISTADYFLWKIHVYIYIYVCILFGMITSSVQKRIFVPLLFFFFLNTCFFICIFICYAFLILYRVDMLVALLAFRICIQLHYNQMQLDWKPPLALYQTCQLLQQDLALKPFIPHTMKTDWGKIKTQKGERVLVSLPWCWGELRHLAPFPMPSSHVEGLGIKDKGFAALY